MTAVELFERSLTGAERRIIGRLDSPARVQSFLDALAYSAEDRYRCPLQVLRDRTGQCFDGALFAASMLRRFGHPPLILNLLPDERDDDHVLALYRVKGHWGAVAKSNFSGLRSREPIHRTLRELVLTYFEQYYNLAREKTLRGYTLPLDLRTFDGDPWMTSDVPLERIAGRLDEVRRVYVLRDVMIAALSPVDERSYRAGLLGSNEAGIYRPPRRGRSVR